MGFIKRVFKFIFCEAISAAVEFLVVSVTNILGLAVTIGKLIAKFVGFAASYAADKLFDYFDHSGIISKPRYVREDRWILTPSEMGDLNDAGEYWMKERGLYVPSSNYVDKTLTFANDDSYKMDNCDLLIKSNFYDERRERSRVNDYLSTISNLKTDDFYANPLLPKLEPIKIKTEPWYLINNKDEKDELLWKKNFENYSLPKYEPLNTIDTNLLLSLTRKEEDDEDVPLWRKYRL